MKIAGFEKQSLVDYPGELAAVVFTPGCNYNCYYCHNRALIDFDAPTIDEAIVWEHLARRRGQLDGVVITGGEPCLQPGLDAFIARVKGLGYMAKLDTNGSRPLTVQKLLDKGLLDYVAVDIKAPAEKYPAICRADNRGLSQTLQALRQSKIPWEARITWPPELDADDIVSAVKEHAPLPRLALQAYRKPAVFAAQDAARLDIPGATSQDMQRVSCRISAYCGEILIRD